MDETDVTVDNVVRLVRQGRVERDEAIAAALGELRRKEPRQWDSADISYDQEP